jgi:hypothetical protein
VKLAGGTEVDTYRVGFLYDVWFLWRRLTLRQPRRLGPYDVGAWRSFLYGLRTGTIERIREGNWRALRNYFNGWLAEHPDGQSSAGRGWTQRAALRRLRRIRGES